MKVEWEEQHDRDWGRALSHGLGSEMIGYPILAFREVGSTNDLAKEFAEHRAPDGLVVTARNQTGGRGRRGRKWVSFPDKAAYLSVVLRPSWKAGDASWLGVLGAVSVADAVETLGVQHVAIKWPNDILIEGRKIAGILVEPRVGEGRLDFAVIGIGINVRQSDADWPEELRGIATSCLTAGADVSVADAIRTLIARMDYWYARLRADDREEMMSRWLAWGGTDQLPVLD